jgi:hypothetical protein
VEKDAAFDFGLNDGAIHVIGEVGVRGEHTHETLPSVLQVWIAGGIEFPHRNMHFGAQPIVLGGAREERKKA